MGKTTNDPAKKKQWKRINTARDFKESHTVGMEFKASDRNYMVTPSGAWKRIK
jgi:hypothetical protein